MTTLLLPLLFLPGGADDTARPPEVTGLIATRVRFRGEAAEKVAEAAVALLASCAYADHPNEGERPDWDDTFLAAQAKSHLHIRLAEPRSVGSHPSTRVDVAEMLVILPLNNGGIWVRSGTKARRLAKYGQAEAIRLQKLLKDAEAVE